MAKFDESKIITALHPEKAVIGKRYWVSDELVDLKKQIEKNDTDYINILSEILYDSYLPFKCGINSWQLLYPYEEPPKMTNIQLMEWLAKGNGVYKNLYGYVHTYFSEKTELLDKEVDEDIVISTWNSIEWIEPTVDIYKRDCK